MNWKDMTPEQMEAEIERVTRSNEILLLQARVGGRAMKIKRAAANIVEVERLHLIINQLDIIVKQVESD